MFRPILVLFLSLLLSAPAAADVPPKLSYQGELTDSNGVAVSGTLSVTFRIYDAEINGNELWIETQSVVFSDEGLFEVLLGDVQSLSPLGFDAPYWLTIQVDGDAEMSPRVPLVSAPYSLNVADDTIDASKIQDGAVVRSLNGLSDDITLVAGSNVTISPSGNTLVISAAAGSGGDTDWNINGTNMSSGVSGNVGIGTTSPSGKLEVVGKMELSGNGSRLEMRNGADQMNVELDGEENGGGGYINLYNSQGTRTIEFDGDEAGVVGMLRLYTGTGIKSIELEGQESGSATDGGILRIFDDTGALTGSWDGKQASGGSVLRLFDEAGTNTIYVDGNEGDSGAVINLNNDTGQRSIEIDSHEGTGDGVIRAYDATGVKTVEINADQGANGNVNIYNESGVKTVELDAREGEGAGQIELFDASGALRIEIDADKGGDSFISVDVLQINGGADLSEQFDVAFTEHSQSPEPGMVVSIDPHSPGELQISADAYDRRVAGVISGAGGVKPGMMMGQDGSIADGEYPVALTGRVYVKADASYGAIEPGDLMTTSDTPGHAMKVTDHTRAGGSVLGKAMTSLKSGQGLVLVLVTLQ